MSRASPHVTPVIDEDFDLGITETTLPYPYSDHCSTGPPSIYEFDMDDEGDERDEEAFNDREENMDNDDDSDGSREGINLDNEDDDTPSLSLLRLKSDSSTQLKPAYIANDISSQLYSKLEVLENDRSGKLLDLQPSTVSKVAVSKMSRPLYSRHSCSYESNGEWQVEEQDDVNQAQDTEEEQSSEKDLLSTVTTAVTSVAYNVGKHWTKKIYESLLLSRDPKAYYTHLLGAATNYEQWSEAASVLDQLNGKDDWKKDPKSPHYDYEMLQERLSQLVTARGSGDLGQMIFLLRTSLSRNIGNIGQDKLYSETKIGTKRLIEDYNSEVIRQLNIICDTESDDFPMAAKLEFFNHTRQAFGRTALLLSGGATMGLMHIGVIKTLFENNLLPRIISGASCGSIIAAILCTCTDDEIPSMLQFENFNFNVFHTLEEKGDYLARVIHFLRNGALFDAQVLKEALKDNIGDITFKEAYNRTRRILNITVSTSASFEMPRLLNYLTAPNVLIWSAVATSCAAPFIYNSAPLIAKNRNGEEVPWNPSRYHWIDGSVENDLPMNRLSELFNVNHFIVCQVNPYIVPFLQVAMAKSTPNKMMGWLLYQTRTEVQHRLNQLSIFGVTPELVHKVQAIMSQRYYGDITIVPSLDAEDYLKIVTNPDIDFLTRATLKGERATWPQISIIKNHCIIEHCLDDILYRLRLRRVEAYQAFPQTPYGLKKMQSEGGYNHKHIVGVTAGSSTQPASNGKHPVRNSLSLNFGPIGRSNSSPASPSISNTMTLSISPSITTVVEHIRNDNGETNGATENSVNGQEDYQNGDKTHVGFQGGNKLDSEISYSLDPSAIAPNRMEPEHPPTTIGQRPISRRSSTNACPEATATEESYFVKSSRHLVEEGLEPCRLIAGSAPTSPVPVVVHTNSKTPTTSSTRGSNKTETTSSTNKKTVKIANRTTVNNASNGSRNKRSTGFHMTTLQNTGK
ncbi:hypothetical protein BGZ76_008730 [Entomortierella beljakovae]|nr:hypothetical protein BGZ76_008730 [Entomortierella beljakovae]